MLVFRSLAFIYPEDSRLGCHGKQASSSLFLRGLSAGRMSLLPDRRGRLSSIQQRVCNLPSSFAYAKLAENGIEDLFDIDRSDDFTKGAQRVFKVDRDILRCRLLPERLTRVVARLKGAPQAIAMSRIDRHHAFRTQIFFCDPRQNFFFELGESLSGQAGDAQRLDAVPIEMLRQIAFIQNNDLRTVSVS